MQFQRKISIRTKNCKFWLRKDWWRHKASMYFLPVKCFTSNGQFIETNLTNVKGLVCQMRSFANDNLLVMASRWQDDTQKNFSTRLTFVHNFFWLVTLVQIGRHWLNCAFWKAEPTLTLRALLLHKSFPHWSTSIYMMQSRRVACKPYQSH
jgi:hypothetical protein